MPKKTTVFDSTLSARSLSAEIQYELVCERAAVALYEVSDLLKLALIESPFGRCSKWDMAGTAALGSGEEERGRERVEEKERGELQPCHEHLP